MKKFLLVLTLLALLGGVGVAIFIATFDADRYRPLVVQELQHALGRPATIGHISLAWRNGIAVELQGLVIPDSAAAAEPLLQLDSASGLVRLWPLLRHEVQVTSLTLVHPRAHVMRDAHGAINLLGLAAVEPHEQELGGEILSEPTLRKKGEASRRIASPARAPVSFNVDSVRIQDGAIHWTDAMAQPLPALTIQALDVTIRHIAPGRPMDLDLRAGVAQAAQNVHVKARALLPMAGQPGFAKGVEVAIERVPLRLLLPAAAPGEPTPRATATVHLAGDLPSLDPAQIARQLSASGSVNLSDVVVENLNVLRIVFEKLSMLPGLVQRLEAHLPPADQQKLTERDTAFAPIDLSLKLHDGVLTFAPVELRTDTVRLSGQGQAGLLDQSITMPAMLRIEPSLSEAIIRSVSELGALANASGEIELPLTIQGRAPKIAALPDLHYVASKVIATKAVDLLEGLLKPKSAAPSTTPSSDATTQPAAPTTEDLVGSLLQRALRKHLPAKSKPQ